MCEWDCEMDNLKYYFFLFISLILLILITWSTKHNHYDAETGRSDRLLNSLALIDMIVNYIKLT